MKKLFGIIIVIFMFSSIGHSKTTEIHMNRVDDIRVYEVCTEGYKFIITLHYRGKAGVTISTVQALGGNGKPQTCVHTE